MEKYRRQALKLAEVTFLGEDEGFAARIPGFRGLIATGDTKGEAALAALPPHCPRNLLRIYDFNSAQTRHFLQRHCGT